MLRQASLALAVSAALLLTAPGVAGAANTYVDNNALDNLGNCLTPATACKTLTGGTGAIAKAGVGDTIFVDGGTYAEGTVVVPNTGQSLIYQEINTPDPPAIVDGGAQTGIGIGNIAPVGTIQGLTIRGDQSALQAFSDVTLIGNTFDEATKPTVFTNGTVHLQDDTATFEVTGNTFTDPNVTDDQWGIRGVLSGTATATISGNTFNGFRKGIQLESTSSGTSEVTNNTITGTHDDPTMLPGIGIWIEGGGANLTHNLVHQPGATTVGNIGITAFSGAAAALARNQVYNQAYGVDFSGTVAGTLNGDVIAHNSAFGLVVANGSASPTVRNATIWGNASDIEIDGVSPTITSSIVEGPIGDFNGPSNCMITFSRGPTTSGDPCQIFQTTVSPAFVDPATGINNFHLTAGSPMIDAGSTIAPPPGTLDVDGDPRVVAGVCGGTPRADIGADEFVPNCTPPAPPADTDPPETTIVKKPGKKLASSKTTVKFSSDEPGSSFQCALDKQPFSPCTSPRRLRGLAPGKHKFQVRAVDPAGNADPSPVGVKFTVAR